VFDSIKISLENWSFGCGAAGRIRACERKNELADCFYFCGLIIFRISNSNLVELHFSADFFI
jgi:hypothetical protein